MSESNQSQDDDERYSDPVWSDEYVPFADPDDESEELPSVDDARPVSAEFALARKFLGKGYLEPDECEESVRKHCKTNDLPEEDFWIAFCDAWELVKYSDNGLDNLEEACEQALKHPISLPANMRPPSNHHVKLASIAWHLSLYTHGNPFLLIQTRLCEALKLTDVMSVSRIIKWLKNRQLLHCVDESWWYRNGKRKGQGKKYILGELLMKTNEDI